MLCTTGREITIQVTTEDGMLTMPAIEQTAVPKTAAMTNAVEVLKV